MTNIVNVGIRNEQKLEIFDILKYGDSINRFVQDAVQERLDALGRKHDE